MFGIFSRYHIKLKRLKKERGWVSAVEIDKTAYENVAWEPPKKLGPGLFFPPVLFSIAPIVHEILSSGYMAMLAVYLINAALVAAFYLFYRLLFRTRPEVIDNDTSLSMALTKVRRYNWSKAWILLAWITGIFNLFFWIFIEHAMGMIITTGVFMAAVLVVALNAEFSARAAQEKLTAKSGAALHVDEDAYWIGGLFYYNPNNDSTLVPERVGINITVNLAKPGGKRLMAVALVMMLTMPIWGIAFMPMEFTPLRIEGTDEAFIMRHSTTYTIYLDDITEIELREELRAISRQWGTGLPNLSAGRWAIGNLGPATLRLNPQYPPFIVIRTNERNYVFGTNEAERTREAFVMLQQRLG